MLNEKFVPFKREQFTLLAKAKRLVLEEFGDEVSLQDKNIVRKIKTYAAESADSRLKDISKSTDKIQVGDMVDGKLCVGLYRGQPVFK